VAPFNMADWLRGSRGSAEQNCRGKSAFPQPQILRAMDSDTILVIDDEPQIRRVLRTVLVRAGYVVVEAENGLEAIDALMRERPSLILLDVNLPDMNGLEVCRRMRLSFEKPIIMLTVRSAEQDKINAFNAGVNDYIVKPFATGELLARIRNALRTSSADHPLPKVETPELTVDLETRTVDVRGQSVHMTPKEFEVLRALVVQQGKAVAYQKLLQTIWGPDYGEEIEKVRAVIGQIRKKIEKDPAHPRYIVTEPWFGYRFQIPSENGSSRRRKS
jgi:two-component system, OmpR family, KDP operon response regulator KdpE